MNPNNTEQIREIAKRTFIDTNKTHMGALFDIVSDLLDAKHSDFAEMLVPVLDKFLLNIRPNEAIESCIAFNGNKIEITVEISSKILTVGIETKPAGEYNVGIAQGNKE